VRGLEWVAADEVVRASLAGVVALEERGVRFSVTPDRLSSVARLRTVDDVFLLLTELPAGRTRSDIAALADGVADADLPPALDLLGTVRRIPSSPSVDVVASLVGNRRYTRFDVEEAVGRRLAARHGWRWVSHREPSPAERSDVTLRAFLSGDRAVIAVRVGARPLHRRDYKVATGPGTLHPPLAAMLAALADLGPDDRVGDPFCGDGTILLEAGPAGGRLFGSDIAADRVRNGLANGRQAGAHVSFVTADAGLLPFRDGAWSRVVTNPPWNVAVDAGGQLRRWPSAGYDEIRRVLGPDGWAVVLLAADDGAEPGLRAAGLPVVLRQLIRISGRVGEVRLLGSGAHLSPPLAAWRERAVRAGLVDEEGSWSAESRDPDQGTASVRPARRRRALTRPGPDRGGRGPRHLER
jgi:tRNA (guanine6-N2)-methyltransferase